MFNVYWLVPPPAPYVTLIKDGRSFAISSVARITFSNVVLVFGGNTSNDNVNASLDSNSESFISSVKVVFLMNKSRQVDTACLTLSGLKAKSYFTTTGVVWAIGTSATRKPKPLKLWLSGEMQLRFAERQNHGW